MPIEEAELALHAVDAQDKIGATYGTECITPYLEFESS